MILNQNIVQESLNHLWEAILKELLIRLMEPGLLLEEGQQLLLHLLHLHRELAHLPLQQLTKWYWGIVDFILLQIGSTFKFRRFLAGQFGPHHKCTSLLEEINGGEKAQKSWFEENWIFMLTHVSWSQLKTREPGTEWRFLGWDCLDTRVASIASSSAYNQLLSMTHGAIMREDTSSNQR